MKFLRNFCLLAVALVALLCGCSESNEDDLKSAKRFEELKALPLDTVLSRAFAFYEQYQATNDTLLRDSMNDYKSHFFARWKRSTDSLCGTIPADDSLAADLRGINEAVSKYFYEYHLKHMYWLMLDSARHESLLRKVDRTQKVELTAPGWKWETKEDHEAAIMGIPFEEALSALKKDSTSMFKVAYFVQNSQVHYVDTVAADMESFQKIEPFDIKREEWKKTKSACMEKTPIGQQVLVLNKEYHTLLKNFMKTKVRVSRQEIYSYTFFLGKYPFWYPMISVVPLLWGNGFHFDSFPTMRSALFNKTHDMVILSVGEEGDLGRCYYLSKKNGKWELVMLKRGCVDSSGFLKHA